MKVRSESEVAQSCPTQQRIVDQVKLLDYSFTPKV